MKQPPSTFETPISLSPTRSKPVKLRGKRFTTIRRYGEDGIDEVQKRTEKESFPTKGHIFWQKLLEPP